MAPIVFVLVLKQASAETGKKLKGEKQVMRDKITAATRVAATLLLASLAGRALLAQDAATATKDDAMARQHLQQASERRYGWDKSLKGFTADFALTRDGKTCNGRVTVKLTGMRGDIEVTCDEPSANRAVQEVLGNTVLHTRAATFQESFGDSTFALGGKGVHGGTVIQLTGHRFFKDFTVKDGFIVQNHGGAGGFESEVNVHQVAWIAELGKTVPKESYATIITGSGDNAVTRNIHTWEDWAAAHGSWFPTRHRSVMTVGEKKTESLLVLDNIKVERTPEEEKGQKKREE